MKIVENGISVEAYDSFWYLNGVAFVFKGFIYEFRL